MMLRPTLLVAALALPSVAVAQGTLSLPPSISDGAAAQPKPAAKAKRAAKTRADRPRTDAARAQPYREPFTGESRAMRPYDPRDDEPSGNSFRPNITPGGRMGVGGRF
ncbi:MAG TPA: hypothetical protein VIL65_05330 [Beijerinckiaceae bacterium]|jgi:hypothetical protein